MRRQSGASLFLQEKVGYQIAPSSDPALPAHLWFMVASPGPDRTVPRTVRPPRGRLWRRCFPFLGYPTPHQLTRQDTPRRVPPAAAGGKNFNHIFPGHVPGKRFLSPRDCRLRRRGSGCIPQFWEPSAAGPKIPAFPSPPSWWAGRYGRKIQGRRPVSEYRKKLSLISDQREAGPGRR